MSKTITRTAMWLGLLSIGYYVLRFKTLDEDSFFSFSFFMVDTVGFIVKVIIQIGILFVAIRSFRRSHESFGIGMGLKIGVLSSILSTVFSYLVILGILNKMFPDFGASANTLSIVGFPIALILSSISGAIIGFVSAAIVRN